MINTMLFQVNTEKFGRQKFALGKNILAQCLTKGNLQDDMKEFEMFG